MSTKNTLDLIEQTRGKVLNDRPLSGEKMFLIWGYPILLFYLLEFISWQIWHAEWCLFIWIGIPLVAVPLTVLSVRQDQLRSHHTEFNKYVILKMWIFIGCLIGLLGFVMGFAGVYELFFYTLVCLLSSTGVFVTGIYMHFRPMIVCSIIAAVLSAFLLFLQGEIWHWQLLGSAIIMGISLLIPGHILYKHRKDYDFQVR